MYVPVHYYTVSRDSYRVLHVCCSRGREHSSGACDVITLHFCKPELYGKYVKWGPAPDISPKCVVVLSQSLSINKNVSSLLSLDAAPSCSKRRQSKPFLNWTGQWLRCITTAAMAGNLFEKVDECPLNWGHWVLFAYNWDCEKTLLYEVAGCPLFRSCLSIEVNGRTVGTFRIVRYIVGVRCWGVSINVEFHCSRLSGKAQEGLQN